MRSRIRPSARYPEARALKHSARKLCAVAPRLQPLKEIGEVDAAHATVRRLRRPHNVRYVQVPVPPRAWLTHAAPVRLRRPSSSAHRSVARSRTLGPCRRTRRRHQAAAKGENLPLDRRAALSQNSPPGYQHLASTCTPTASTRKSSKASGISPRCTTSVVGPTPLQLLPRLRCDHRQIH
jgi:hypothetical protein